MYLLSGNLFDQPADAICLTTNGCVKANGEAVMGRGCAHTAARRWPEIPGHLGTLLRTCGVHVHLLTGSTPNGPSLCSQEMLPYHLVSFPVKPVTATFTGSNAVTRMTRHFSLGDVMPGWACRADLSLIRRSAEELVGLTNEQHWTQVILPRPGCGAGELSWEAIRPLLATLLDDRFGVISFPPSQR